MKFYRTHILIGIDDVIVESKARKVIASLKTELDKKGLSDEVNVLETGSLGYFDKGICLQVLPDNLIYGNITAEDIPELVSEHFLKGRPVKRLLITPVKSKTIKPEIDLNYDKRIVLENSGLINPESIDEYLGVGGYEALEKALMNMQPSEIVEEVKNSGLRGRGGAGFPTGLKWSFTAPIKEEEKYLVINADEGEPGTFKDRLIMEGDPHKLLEGMMIACRAIGATKAFIYIRGEYKLCINRLEIAIKQAYEYGLLGKNIFDTGFDLDIEIRVGAGAYVCGEETALIESLEGNRGTPRWKPPFPGQKGVWQKPTVVNNVETIANVPSIIKNGADWYMSHGTPKCPGTKVYTIMGDVEVPGLCEVNMGATLDEIINKYAGGMKDGKEFKAALVGGAAGVFLSKNMLDVQMDYDNLKEYSAVLGSGAILVMSEGTNMVEMLSSVIHFFRHESCGKCVPCRFGTAQLNAMMNKLKAGAGTSKDMEEMLSLSKTMVDSAFCALGQSLHLPIKTAFENYNSEFVNLIK